MLNTIFLAIVKPFAKSAGEYKYISIDAKNIKTVKDLRDAAAIVCNFECGSFRIIFAGNILENENLSVIDDYHMQDKTTVFIMRQRKRQCNNHVLLST